jgi:hypothetical protein
MKSRYAFPYPKPSPFSPQCQSRGIYRGIDLSFACFRNLRDHGTIRRIYVSEILGSIYETAIDVILDDLHEILGRNFAILAGLAECGQSLPP